MNKERKIKVLLVEDAGAATGGLAQILNSDPAIQMVGVVRNGRGALAFLARHNADIVLLDIETPVADGSETTRMIMETRPLPIVICNRGGDPRGSVAMFRSMEAGAVACVERPREPNHREFRQRTAHLLQTLKLMSEIKVVHRWPRSRRMAEAEEPAIPSRRMGPCAPVEIVGIGASTGGPPVLRTILAALPRDFAVPVLIVQHIAPGFLAGLAEWLGQTTGMKIHIPAHQFQTHPGHVYLAPDGQHMTVEPGGSILLSRGEPDNGMRPSVNRLFRSLADGFGPGAVGVLLTGMGKDGADELKRMRDNGATTIAQDQETSVVHGMPGEAIALGAASYIFPPDKIAPALAALVQQQPVYEGVQS
jgi:two-component system, chemotaxis family, protein-glutamate methylesterase/glutaminase